MVSPAQFDALDRAPARIRNLHGRVIGSRGAVHLTSFLPPLALIAKFAIPSDWDSRIIPFLQNPNDETATMIADGGGLVGACRATIPNVTIADWSRGRVDSAA